MNNYIHGVEIFQNSVVNLAVYVREWSEVAALEPSCSSVIPISVEMTFVEDFGVVLGGGIARKEIIGLSLCSITNALINGVGDLYQL